VRIKLVGVSGSPVKNGNTETLLEKTLREIETEEVGVDLIKLSQAPVSACLHCNWCVRKQSEQKLCVLNDVMDEIYPKLLAADIILLATPVYFGRLSGSMADFIDRCRVAVHGRVYRHAFKNKVGAGLALSYLRHGGVESALLSLLAGFLVLDMIPVSSAGSGSTFGGGALSSYHGEGVCERDDGASALKDAFGLNSWIKTAQRAVDVARLLKAGAERCAGA
jgi:multimeric flavodoxin WrbA